jgi:electron transfer flavoprotein beta subunit
MALHIIVCIKSVVMKAPENGTTRSADTAEMNLFDKPALESAVALVEKEGGTVTALSMGPKSCSFVLHEAIAMGAERGVLLSDPSLADSDTLATSTALGAAIKKLEPYDIVLFGTRTYDSDTGQVGPQTAVSLDIPLVTGVSSLNYEKPLLRVERKVDGFSEEYNLSLPAALTIHPASVKPRDIPLGGIEEAFEKKKIETWTLNDLSLDPKLVGSTGSPTEVISMRKTVRERQCELLEGTAEEQAEALIDRIKKRGIIG